MTCVRTFRSSHLSLSTVAGIFAVSLAFALGACGDSAPGAVDDAAVDGGSTTDGSTSGGDGSSTDAASSDAAGGDTGSGDGSSPTVVFACSSVTPQAGNLLNPVELTLAGYLFANDATVVLVNLIDGNETDLGAAAVTDGGSEAALDSATVTVPAETPQGLYEVFIINPDTTGGVRASCGTYRSLTEAPPAVSAVAPDSAWEGSMFDAVLSDTSISITGAGFNPTPAVRFISVATGDTFDAADVGFIDATSLTAVVPSESLRMPVGDYHVEVINPSGLSALWRVGGVAQVFRVIGTPPPRIDDVTPFKIAVNAKDAEVVVSGDFFDDSGAALQVQLLREKGDPITVPRSGAAASYTVAIDTAPQATDTITLTIDVGALGLDIGIYPLRVVNADGQYDTYFSLQVDPAEPGKLNTSPFVQVSTLVIPRERLAVVNGFDVFANSYIYAVGGTTIAPAGSSPRPRPVLRSSEVLRVNVFGTPQEQASLVQQLSPAFGLGSGDPRHQALHSDCLLNTPRSALALVRAGAQLYAIGGAATDTWNPDEAGNIAALSTVEQAHILGYDERPNLSLPRVSSSTHGLPTGTWYYRVSAVGPWGESLPSREVVARQGRGTIGLTWAAVSGATSYIVYRSLAADGRSGTTRAIATGISATTFDDDGQGMLAPAPRVAAQPLAGGTLSAASWTYRVTALVAGAGETLASYAATVTLSAAGSVQLAWSPIADATGYNVYRVAQGDQPTNGPTYLLASNVQGTTFTDDGSYGAVDTSQLAPDGNPPLQPGALSWWRSLSNQLNHRREGARALVLTAFDGNPATTDDPTYVYVVGGRANNVLNSDYDATSERALIDPETGTLGAWEMVTQSGSEVKLNTPRGFFALVTTQGRNITPVPPPPALPPCPDDDGDGFTNCSCGGNDCNDADPTVFPGAVEICGDGLDQDCDAGCQIGTDISCGGDSCLANADLDGDGYDRIECGGNDCNDADASINPGAAEICGDGIDQDCSGSDLPCTCADPDRDNDGFNSLECGGNDCDDSDPTICPDATACPETLCDGIDQDCKGGDACIILYSATTSTTTAADEGFSTPYYPDSLSLLAASTSALPEEPALVIAMFGDESFAPATGGGSPNTGLDSLEVATVRRDGMLSAWTTQTSKNSVKTSGNDGLIVGDYAFSAHGVIREFLGVDPIDIWANFFSSKLNPDVLANAATNWDVAPPANVLIDPGPGAAVMQTPRCYHGLTRLNGYIFGLGGNGGGTGPLADVERIEQ